MGGLVNDHYRYTVVAWRQPLLAITDMTGISRYLVPLLLLLALVQYKSVMADWLNICQHRPAIATASLAQQYFKANGESFWFLLSSEPVDQCEHKELDLAVEDIDWTELISTDTSSRINQRIILQGLHNNETIKIAEIIADRPEAAYALSDSLGIARNLLTDFSIRAFGSGTTR